MVRNRTKERSRQEWKSTDNVQEDAYSTEPDVKKQGTEEVIREVVGEESKEYRFETWEE